MAKKKEERKYCNVALLPEDHDMLNALASEDQRSMTRQLSVIIRKEYAKVFESARHARWKVMPVAFASKLKGTLLHTFPYFFLGHSPFLYPRTSAMPADPLGLRLEQNALATS